MRHRFEKWVILFFTTDWKCAHCGMKVKSTKQMRYLEGKECF